MEFPITLSKDKLNIVVAYTSENRYIGCEKDLPWKRKLKGDKQFMRKIIVPEGESKILLIMGRVTYETCPKMKSVKVAVITTKELVDQEVAAFKTFDEAIAYGKENDFTIVVFGGENVYREALKYNHRLFCTVINDSTLPGDRKFPECRTQIENISGSVELYLLARGVNKTWEIINNEFSEDGFTYGFYCGESQ